MNAMGRLVEGLALPQPYLLFLGDTQNRAMPRRRSGWLIGRAIAVLPNWVCRAARSARACRRWTPPPPCRRCPRHRHRRCQSGRFHPAVMGGCPVAALEAGLDIISGMHARLEAIPELAEAAQRTRRRLINVRTPPAGIPIGTGRKRSGKRLLTVAPIVRWARNTLRWRCTGRSWRAASAPISGPAADRHIDRRWRHSDGRRGLRFRSRRCRDPQPRCRVDHWDVVEGQGSLFNPAYAAVSLGLLHGSQPDVFVVCHDPIRTHMLGLDGYALPAIEEVIDMTIRLGTAHQPGHPLRRGQPQHRRHGRSGPPTR